MDPMAHTEKTDQAFRRQGPRPLELHLMQTLTTWLSLAAMWPHSKNGWLSSNPEVATKLVQLQAKGASANPDFTAALEKAAVVRARAFLSGIKAYRHHPARRTLNEAPVIWHKGTTLLRDYNPGTPDAPVMLVIPSLINRFDILDLDRGHSFLRALTERGFRPLVVDWGRPGDEEQHFGLTDYVGKRLIPVLEFIQNAGIGIPDTTKKTYAGRVTHPQFRIHLAGYCMGGLLALALAALRPDQIRSLTLLATPWDFHKPDAAIGAQFLALAVQMEPYLKALGHLPVDVIQSLFATFQPMQVMGKFTSFAALDPLSIEARQFVLLEDWLNDGVPLPAPAARECFIDWYGENRTAKTEWHIEGAIVDPRKLAMPAYVVAPGKDRIVPPESAKPLAKLLPHASLHEPMAGHIGIIASAKAPQQVWLPLFHWLDQHK